MWIRHKGWDTDGLPVYVCDVNLRHYVFEDANQGIVDVREKRDLEYFLSRPNIYELAYERYGVEFDAQGQEQQIPPMIPCETAGIVGSAIGVNVDAKPAPIFKKRGRPKKRR